MHSPGNRCPTIFLGTENYFFILYKRLFILRYLPQCNIIGAVSVVLTAFQVASLFTGKSWH